MRSKDTGESDQRELRERKLKHNIKLGYSALAIWPFALFASLMAGDAPGSEHKALHIFSGVFAAGFIPLITHITARTVSAFGRYRIANVIALLPIIAVGTLVGGLIVWSLVMDMLLVSH